MLGFEFAEFFIQLLKDLIKNILLSMFDYNVNRIGFIYLSQLISATYLFFKIICFLNYNKLYHDIYHVILCISYIISITLNSICLTTFKWFSMFELRQIRLRPVPYLQCLRIIEFYFLENNENLVYNSGKEFKSILN